MIRLLALFVILLPLATCVARGSVLSEKEIAKIQERCTSQYGAGSKSEVYQSQLCTCAMVYGIELGIYIRADNGDYVLAEDLDEPLDVVADYDETDDI